MGESRRITNTHDVQDNNWISNRSLCEICNMNIQNEIVRVKPRNPIDLRGNRRRKQHEITRIFYHVTFHFIFYM